MAIFLNIIAKTMNAGGCAIVSAFDAGAAAFNCTMSALSPGERTKLGNRIKEMERKIQALTSGIAKETSKYADPAAALESESVKALLNAVKELHKEIEPMKRRIAEIDATKIVKKTQQESAGISSCISQSITGLMPGEKAGLQKKMFANEKKIQTLYTEFAKEVAKQPDPYEAINSQVVTAINAKINELNAENSTLKLQIADLAKPKAEKQKTAEKKPQPEAKKPQPESSSVAKFFIHAITNSVSGYLPGEKSNIERKLHEYDKKIQGLYLDVAKESAKYPDPTDAVTAGPVVALVAKINELKAEVATLNQRKAELSGIGKAKAATAAVKAAATPVQAEPASEEVPVEVPVSAEAVAAEDAAAVLPETETNTSIDAADATPEQTESDPSEGTPFVHSRTKSCDIAEPILQPPTEEDIKAVVREIQAEEALSEQTIEEVEASTEEPPAVAEPAITEEQIEAPAAAEPAVTEEQIEAPDASEPAVDEELAAETDISAETVAEEADKEAEQEAVSADAVVEHPPFVPVPEAEEVFGLQETETVTTAAADEVPQEDDSAVDATEADAGEAAVPALQDDAEIAPEPAVETISGEVAENSPTTVAAEEDIVTPDADTSVEEAAVPPSPAAEESPAVATSARADAFGVTTDYSPVTPVSRPETTTKEESGSGFRTRLFRNQFSILTPVPVETSASNLEPPSREEIETVARSMEADDVEKYKLNEILEERAAETETSPDTEKVSDQEAVEKERVAAEIETSETEETDAEETDAEETESDVPDYFKKLSERRSALLPGSKDSSAASGKGGTKKRK